LLSSSAHMAVRCGGVRWWDGGRWWMYVG
jgi:hypothetical protein